MIKRSDGSRLTYDMVAEQRMTAVRLIKELIDTSTVPEVNCSCHLHPPCGDCVEWGQARGVLNDAKEFIKRIDV